MEQRTEPDLSPYRVFSRAEWATLRADTPMTLEPAEIARLRSLHDRLDISEVEEIYLPLSRLLSLYVAAWRRKFLAPSFRARSNARGCAISTADWRPSRATQSAGTAAGVWPMAFE